MLARAVAAQLHKALVVEIITPSQKIILKNSDVLNIKMIAAAERFGVDSHVIESRIKRSLLVNPTTELQLY